MSQFTGSRQMQMGRALRICILTVVLLAGSRALAQTIEPALAPDPKVMEIVNGLGDNTGAVLPALKTVGEWNAVNKEFQMDTRGPEGRQYCSKASWMPDRQRALYCGSNHGAPHRLNDAWEYDLPSNTWVQLFAPDPHQRSLDGPEVIRAEFAKGYLEIVNVVVPGSGEKLKYAQTKRGGPSHLGHTWWGFSYDPVMKAGLWMNVGISSRVEWTLKEMAGSADDCYLGPPMWAYFPYEKKWKMTYTPKPWPRIGYAKQMEYVPDLGGTLFMTGGHDGDGTWLYDPKANAWKQLGQKSGEQPDNESVCCYDPGRKLILAQSSHHTTHHYDIKANKWSLAANPGKDKSSAPWGFDSAVGMFYDPLSKQALLHVYNEPERVWSYDPDAKKWTANKVNGAPCTGASPRYFDEARNVLVCNMGPRTWVYRYKRAPNGKK